MSGPEPIFDTALLRHRLARARALGATDFLLVRAADDLADRLATIKRDFVSICDLGTAGAAIAAAVLAKCANATLVRIGALQPAPGDVPAMCVVGDPERLPLASASLDLVVSGLALQTANDLPGIFIQVRRALKPDGLFLAALLGGRTLHELRSVLTEAEAALSGGASPRVAPFADVRDLGALLQRAGFALPVADSETVTVRYDGLFALMADLRAMGATNALVARSRRFTRRELFARAAALYQQRFADPDGKVRATFEILWVSGWAPHASQQPPARRGSGQVSLAAALGDKARP